MADGPAKKEAGPTEKRTVLKLKPVSYKVTLLFMGASRIKRDAAPAGAAALPVVDAPPPYRCRYEFRQKNGASDAADAVLNPLHPIPNVVREGDDAEASVKAANPTGVEGAAPNNHKGDPTNPVSDIVYKVMIVDNHGTRTAENLDLLGSDGDLAANSNPRYYRDRGWLPDIMPAVPFRVIVRKYIGKEEVGLDKGLKVVVAIKDPVEEFSQNDGKRKTFLEKFFAKYNRADADPDPGDDNAHTWFRGIRPSNAATKATAVLRKLAYKDKPAVDKPPADADKLDFSADAGAAAEHESTKAVFDVKPVDQDGKKVGVADFAFMPAPVCGDNYRFQLTLLEDGKDVRDVKANGQPIILQDDQGKPVAKPRTYVTGRFVVWRKAEYTMCVLVNGTTENDINWDFIIRAYRKTFLEVVKPANFLVLTRAAWHFHLKQMFPGVAGVNDAANFTNAHYQNALFPPIIHASFAGDEDAAFEATGSFTRRCVAKGCIDAGIPNPDSAPSKQKQTDGSGSFMMLCKNISAGTTLGAYFGDRMFWFRIPTNNGPANATSTCAHEFAHLKSIRHAHTTGPWVNVKVGAATTNTRIIDSLSNNNILDHDGKDAFSCLQSYTRPIDAEPCAMCALSMRFYDRVQIQAANRYRQEIINTYGPVSLFYIAAAGGGHEIRPFPAAANLPVNRVFYVLVLTDNVDFTTRSGGADHGRVNLNFSPRQEGGTIADFFTKNNNHVELSVVNHATEIRPLKVKGLSVGATTIKWRDGKNPTASFQITVTP